MERVAWHMTPGRSGSGLQGGRMQRAVGATPERMPTALHYGRLLNLDRVKQITAQLSENAWDTDEAPAVAPATLLLVAESVRDELQYEHDVTMYDPKDWARRQIWYNITLCDLLLEGNLQAANELVADDEEGPQTQFRPAVVFLPALRLPAPPSDPAIIERIKTIVRNHTNEDFMPVNAMYKRAVLEIELHKYPELRSRVHDEHLALPLIDATFDVDDGTPVVFNEYEPTVIARYNDIYQRLRTFETTDINDHYSGTAAEASLPYQPHVHAICKWIVYFNAENPTLKVVLCVGNSRGREMPSDVSAVCWVSQDLCGIFNKDTGTNVDADHVWDLIVEFNERYSNMQRMI